MYRDPNLLKPGMLDFESPTKSIDNAGDNVTLSKKPNLHLTEIATLVWRMVFSTIMVNIIGSSVEMLPLVP